MPSLALPRDVQADLDNGFVMTDIDDCFQRCKKTQDKTWLYRSGTCDQHYLAQLPLEQREPLETVYEEEIDVYTFNHELVADVISGYYDSFESMVDEFGEESANMLLAECYFEQQVSATSYG